MKLKPQGIGTEIYPINKTKALKCTESIEDEVHLLFQCTENSYIKTDLSQRIAMDIPQAYLITPHISPSVYKSRLLYPGIGACAYKRVIFSKLSIGTLIKR